MRTARIVTLTSLICLPIGVLAEEQVQVAPQVQALQDCRTKPDAAARLACYDKAVDALTAATASRDVVVIDRAEVRKTRKGLFGFALPKIGFLSGREGNKDDALDEAELTSTVLSARTWNREYWHITLADGGVWETTSTARGFDDPKPGRPVRIERGTLGAFWLTVGKHGRVQARRIK